MRAVVMGRRKRISLPIAGMKAVRLAAVSVAGLIVVIAASLQASAQSGGVEFGSRSACERSARFSTDQCANAFTNAQAEWDEGMPRFAKRDECEKRFRRCQIAGLNGGKVNFQPVMDKVVITHRGGNITVLPVAPAAARGGPRFSERTILQRKPERSDRRQAEAQKQWEALWAAADAGASNPDGTPIGTGEGTFTIEKPEAFDPNWQKQEGVRMYPGPAARQKKPQS
jgi:hypothetical protein